MNLSNATHPRRRLWSRFARHEGGVALIEFAITFPILFLLLFGGIEVVRLMLIQQKLEKTGYVIADIITQYNPATSASAAGEISVNELTTNVFPQFNRTMSPYSVPVGALSPDQAVIVTSIKKEAGVKLVKWQIAGGGTLSGCDTALPSPHCVTSIVNGLAPAGIGAAVLDTPTAFPATEEGILAPMEEQSNMVVVEVFYYYRPILRALLQGVGNASSGAAGFSFFLDDRIYIKRTYFAPRRGDMFHLPPTFPAP